MQASSPPAPGSRHALIVAAFVIAAAEGAAWALRYAWDRSLELGYVIDHLALIGVSLFASWWPALLAVNLVGGGAWVLISGRDFRAPTSRLERLFAWLRQFVTFVNRQLGHLEALFAWTTIACVFHPDLRLQLPLLGAVLTLGPTLIDGAAVARQRRGNDDVPGNALFRRRPYFYVAACAGWFIVVGLAFTQWRELVGLIAAIAVGVGLRWWTWYRLRAHEGRREKSDQLATDTAHWDRAIVALALLVAAIAPAVPLLGANKQDATDHTARARGWHDCKADSAFVTQASVFIVSDSQFHELDGKRTGTHLDLVDSIVPVAVRPVELDLLSGVAVRRFAAVYRALAPPPPWVHLGDFADLGCAGELARWHEYLPDFATPDGQRHLAALVPGNHDSTFIGNFSWHPDWSVAAACPTGPLRKRATNEQLAAYEKDFAVAAEPSDALPNPGQALVRLVRLGSVAGKPLDGIFLDSSDYGPLRLGIAGVQGSIGCDQSAWLQKVAARERDAGAYVVIFMHHPFASLSRDFGQAAVEAAAKTLGPQLLALVTAHTHLAALRPKTQKLPVPEFVVGSTTDPPAEASLLEVGVAGGRVLPRLRTLPLVARDGETCPPPAPAITKAACEAARDRIDAADECKPLMGEPYDAPDAQLTDECAHPEEWWDVLQHAQQPRLVKCMQEERAWRLRRCLRRGLDDWDQKSRDLFDHGRDLRLIADLERAPEELEKKTHSRQQRLDREDELTCLMWSASILQGHKESEWTFASAFYFAFEHAATYGARLLAPK